MIDPAPHNLPDGLPISVVERETGIPKDLLRMWERRYGFPEPARDAQGDRVYPREQVDKLRAVRRLMDQGFRPGKIIHLEAEELARLSEARRPRAAAPAVCARLETLLRDAEERLLAAQSAARAALSVSYG